MKKILIINGPNLNVLEKRGEDYGQYSLEKIKKTTESKLKENFELTWIESNSEEDLIEAIQKKAPNFSGLIINPGALSHYSIALYDALLILKIPIVEVHLSQIYKREVFRQKLLTGRAASIIMTGLKQHSYYHGALAIGSILEKEEV